MQVRKTHTCQVTTEGRGPWEHTIPSGQKSKLQPPLTVAKHVKWCSHCAKQCMEIARKKIGMTL